MLLFLTVLLFLHLGNAQDPNVTTYAVELMNGYRAQIAKGQLGASGGTLPSTLNMFALEADTYFEYIAEYNVIGCPSSASFIPQGTLNYYSSLFFDGATEKLLVSQAVGMWRSEAYQYALDSQVTYNNQKLQNFANMIYYKSTKVGCAYQKCDATGTTPAMYAVACAFNSV
ncbi:SCP-like protein [Ostertagia ostertagi]